MQVFDTHRLPYRNAKLRAWANIAKTTPVKFYDVTDPTDNTETEIGTEVVTDEVGYLFYGNGTTKVNGLIVHDACIMEVSLDNGMSWPIQWILQGDGTQPITVADIKSLSYYDDQHNLTQYNPALGASQLPDYLRRAEFTPGIWAEGEISVDDDAFEINQWTHSIKIQAGANATIAVTGSLRAGQIITIVAGRDCTLSLAGTTRNLVNGHTYLWWWTNLVTDITYVDDTHIANVCKDTIPTRVQQSYSFVQSSSGQTLTSATVPHKSPLYIRLYSPSNYAGPTIVLPAPDFVGCCDVIVDALFDNINTTTTVDIQIGTNAAVTAITATTSGQHIAYGKLIAWTDTNSVRRYKLVIEGTV